MHEQTIMDIPINMLRLKSNKMPEADHLGNENMHAVHHSDNLKFSDELEGIKKGHQAVAIQFASSSSSFACPDFQEAPDVTLPQENDTAHGSHEIVNPDIINHTDNSVEHVGL